MAIKDLARPLNEQELATLLEGLEYLSNSFMESSFELLSILATNSSFFYDCVELGAQGISCEDIGATLLDWLFPGGSGVGSSFDEIVDVFGNAIRTIEKLLEAAPTLPERFNYTNLPIHPEVSNAKPGDHRTTRLLTMYWKTCRSPFALTYYPKYPNANFSGTFRILDGPFPRQFAPEGRKAACVLVRTIIAENLLMQRIDLTNATSTDEEFYFSMFNPPFDSSLQSVLDEVNVLQAPALGLGDGLDLDSDRYFVRQFLTGTNPVMIRRCRLQQELSTETLSFLASQSIDVPSLVASDRLFFVDYTALQDLPSNPHDSFPDVLNGNSSDLNNDGSNDGVEFLYFFPSWVVFILQNTDNQQEDFLDVAAIQLNPPNRSPYLYSRETSTPAEWRYAKLAILNADSQYHEVSCLLPFTCNNEIWTLLNFVSVFSGLTI